MKIAIVSVRPDQCWVDKAGWVADGFTACGHDVRRCHTLEEVAMADAECDVLLFDQKAAGLQHVDLANMAQSHKAVWVHWWRDLIAQEPGLPLAKQSCIQTHLRLLRASDYVLVKERSLLDEYRSLGIPAQWFDQACPADMPACTHLDKPEWDVLVFGCTSYDQRRADVRELVDAGYRVLWLASYASVPLPAQVHCLPWTQPYQLPAIASRCAVVLGVDYRTDLPGFTSDRSYLVAGMGACYVSRYADYGDHSLTHSPAAQLSAWVYDDEGSLLDVMRQAVADPDERRKRGTASRALVMARHTYRNRAAELCQLIGIEQGRRLVEAAGVVT